MDFQAAFVNTVMLYVQKVGAVSQDDIALTYVLHHNFQFYYPFKNVWVELDFFFVWAHVHMLSIKSWSQEWLNASKQIVILPVVCAIPFFFVFN